MTLASAATSQQGLPVLTVELKPFTRVPTLVSDRLVTVWKSGSLPGPRISAELLPGSGDSGRPGQSKGPASYAAASSKHDDLQWWTIALQNARGKRQLPPRAARMVTTMAGRDGR